MSSLHTVTTLRRRTAVQGLVAAACWPQVGLARAQAYPARDLLVVVPSEPGGGLDLVARALAPALATALSQTVNVVNRSGASGTIGTASVARADADGHTLLLSGVGHLVSALLHDKPGYDPLRDFVALARIATAPNVLMTHSSLQGLNLARLLADPRSAHAGLSYASPGFGSSPHLAAEVFMHRAGARWLHVPYRGTAPASRALLAGDVQLMFVPAGSVRALLDSGRARALAVAHPERLAALSAVPTLAELGVTSADFSQWYGLFAPAGTPQPVCDRLQRIVTSWVDTGAVRQQLQAQGLEPAPLAQSAFTAFVADEARRLKDLLSRVPVDSGVSR